MSGRARPAVYFWTFSNIDNDPATEDNSIRYNHISTDKATPVWHNRDGKLRILRDSRAAWTKRAARFFIGKSRLRSAGTGTTKRWPADGHRLVNKKTSGSTRQLVCTIRRKENEKPAQFHSVPQKHFNTGSLPVFHVPSTMAAQSHFLPDFRGISGLLYPGQCPCPSSRFFQFITHHACHCRREQSTPRL